MSTIIKVDTNSKAARAFIAFVKTLPFAKIEELSIVEEPRAEYNAETKKAIEESRAGKTFKVKNSDELFEELGI
ncbi:hypothetical protein [Brumimicrobium oceani]|uniref:Uncharacterized protein n=1 Tax=Brumimicrobium oceani TaxID=2100725 RepID=A0A2U2XFN7_9FLAO|nr:hypothetical protein [Brumimicrobium oceani]PWH86521.1 hypothetical protein DIT68_04605 [Brumimicrobium oceani]